MTLRRYTPELAVDLRVPLEPRLSPDRRFVAFRVEPLGHRETDRTGTLFVAPTDGSAAPRPLTDSDHHNVAPVWSPDGRALAFLSDRPERGKAQLHLVPVAGGEPARLTSLAGGVGNPTWSPDGRWLAFTARRRSLAGQPEPKNDIKVASEQPRPQAIARVPITGGPPSIVGPREGHVWTFALSPDGARVAALTSPTDELAGAWDNVRLIAFPVAGGEEHELLRLSGFPSQPPRWSEDGRLVAVVGSRLPSYDDTNVYVVDVANGEVTVFDDRDRTPTWVSFDGETLLVHQVDGQRTRLDRTDSRGSEWESLDLGPTVAGGWVESAPNIHALGGALALNVARHDRPPDVHVALPGAAALRLTDLNPQLDGVALAGMEHLTWDSSDGMRIDGWLLLPPGSATPNTLPLVTAIHGGPSWQWGNWFHGTWHDWGQVLAGAGYAVFMPNPRGSTGRGGRFVNANQYDFGGRDFVDIMAGIDHLIARGVADPSRLGICGWSYGGFMTAWAITQTDRFKAAVAGAAPTNWVSKIGTTDIRPFNEWNLGAVNTEPDRVWERSPIRYVGRVTTPTLILHGEADARVPVTQGAELYQALKALGIPTEMVSYPRQGHAFHERAHQLDLLQRLLGWFDRYLQGGDRVQS